MLTVWWRDNSRLYQRVAGVTWCFLSQCAGHFCTEQAAALSKLLGGAVNCCTAWLASYCVTVTSSNVQSGLYPLNSIWPHLSYGLVRSKTEYCHNCSLVVVLCSFYSCTVFWAVHRFCLPDLASSHWVHSLCLGYFVCVRLFSCIISACML